MKHGPYIPHEFGEDAEAHYSKAMGWLTAACSTSIPWPEEDARVTYDGDDYFLRGMRQRGGQTTRSGPCITMRCRPGQANEVLAKLYRFTSVLGWFKHGYVDVSGHITGSHASLYSVPQSFAATLAGGRHAFNCNHMPLIRDDKTRRALAFWREGVRLHHLHTGYAFLSFFKVIESQFTDADDRIRWIAEAIPKLDGDAAKRVQALSTECDDVGKHIYKSGRNAVAHAQFSDGRGDPDVPEDRTRLAEDLAVIEALARRYIADVLQVPDADVVYRTRDRLEALSALVPAQAISALKAKQFVSRRRVGLDGVAVGFAHWPHAPVPELARLTLRVTEVRDGLVFVHATNDSGSACIACILDFPSCRAHIDFDGTTCREPRPGEAPDDAIAVVQFCKEVRGNGLMELWLPDGGRVDFEIVIPVNIDFDGTFRTMDAEVARLEAMRKRD